MKKREANNEDILIILNVAAVLVLFVFLFSGSLPFITSGNLMKFYELTKNDPLFFDPEMDVDFLRESVAEMNQQDNVFLLVDQVYRKKEPPEFQFPKEWRLWPDEFLATLPDIHDATSAIIDDPSPMRARRLLDLYNNAVSFYKKAVNLNLQVFDSILEKKPQLIDQKILYLGSGTAPEVIRNNFVMIQNNALELEREIERRKTCLFQGICIAHEKQQSFPQESVKVAFQPLPDEILRMSDSSEVEGPFWATTSCFGNIDGKPLNLPFYLKLKPSESSTRMRLEAILTNEKYYRDYTQIPNETLAKIQLKNGIKYRQHLETTDYLCSDMGYLADLFMNHFEYNGDRENKLKTLPYLIQNTLSVASFMSDQTEYARKSFHPLYLLINRGAYSLYFGTFTPMIWRIEEDPKFLLDGNFDFRPGYVTYEDLKNRGFSDVDILKIYDVPSIYQVYGEELRTEKE